MDKRRSRRTEERGNRPPSLLFFAVACAIASLWVWSSVAQGDVALHRLDTFVAASGDASPEDGDIAPATP